MMLSVVPTMEFNDFADSVYNVYNAEKDKSIVLCATKYFSKPTIWIITSAEVIIQILGL